MNKLITEWCAFCEGKIEFDKSHFYTLFWEDIGLTDLPEIFKYFPNSEILIELTGDYLFGKSNMISSLLTNDELIQLALNDVVQKKKLIGGKFKLIEIDLSMKVEFIEDYRIVENQKNKDPYVTFFDSLSDHISDCWIVGDKKTFALHEAFYGLTKYYEMTWYLFKPLTNVTVDFKYYYELTKRKGVYAFLDDRLIVSQIVTNGK